MFSAAILRILAFVVTIWILVSTPACQQHEGSPLKSKSEDVAIELSDPIDKKTTAAAIVHKQTTSIDTVTPHATGICLAEIIERKQVDLRAGDGPLYVEFKLKILRSSGSVHEQLDVVLYHQGGHGPPSMHPRKKTIVTFPSEETLVGKRFWLAFSSKYDFGIPTNPRNLIGAWPEEDTVVAEVFAEAIRADRFQWQPQYDSETGLVFEHTSQSENGTWKLRVQRDNKVLWEKTVPGLKTANYFELGYYGSYEGFPSSQPSIEKILIAPSLVKLETDNEFKIEAGDYHINTGFDPVQGHRLAVWIYQSLGGDRFSEVVFFDYDPENGNLISEDRFELQNSGGKRMGASNENWRRKTSRKFDRTNGNVTSQRVFRFEESHAHTPSGYVPVRNDESP
jgi:hypothetical protein